jgi:hypothetical protein
MRGVRSTAVLADGKAELEFRVENWQSEDFPKKLEKTAEL